MSTPSPNDDFGPDLPPEELEMIMEEVMGRPLVGSTADRIAALEKRIKYLSGALLRTEHIECAIGYREDLQAAQEQLTALRHQQSGRN